MIKLHTTEDLIINSEGFGLLRKALIENMGQKKAKKFLFQFGYQLGTTKAKEIMHTTKSLDELLKEAPKVHIMLKHVSKVDLFGSSLSFHSEDLKENEVWGIWHDSFEVLLQLKNHGMSQECTCYTLCGFASGFLSIIHALDIYVFEMTCRSKGDPQCSFKIMTRQECERLQINLDVFDESTIIDELELTYDSLYEHKALLEKVTNYHGQLTDAILQQQDINSILNTAQSILHIPIYITNSYGQYMHACGLTDEQIEALNKNPTYFKQTAKPSGARIQQMDLITAPIYLDKTIYATVSFIYFNDFDKNDKNHDFLFLERLAEVSSLYFLNDKVRFETTERLKFSFLDRLIQGQFTCEKEMIRHSQYIQPSLQAPYCIVSIKYQVVENQAKLFDLYNQIFQLARLFSLYQIHGLITSKDDHFIILFYNIQSTTSLLNSLSKILQDLTKTNQGIVYKAGISDFFDQLQDFKIYIEQAEQAMHFPRAQSIIQFTELGLLGTIVSKLGNEQLKNVTIAELGELYTNQEKNKELLQTLYVYLKNNGHLEKTMQELSLSIGGIKYRINKIEKLLNKDLKNALTTSYLLLLIESLIVLHEISFN